MRGINGALLFIVVLLLLAASVYVYAQMRLNSGVSVGKGVTLSESHVSTKRNLSAEPHTGSTPQCSSDACPKLEGYPPDEDSGCISYSYCTSDLSDVCASKSRYFSVPNCDVTSVVLDCRRKDSETYYFTGSCYGREGVWRLDVNAAISGMVPRVRTVLRDILKHAGVSSYAIGYSPAAGVNNTEAGSVVLGGYHDCNVARLLPGTLQCHYRASSGVFYYNPAESVALFCNDSNAGTAIAVMTVTTQQRKSLAEQCH